MADLEDTVRSDIRRRLYKRDALTDGDSASNVDKVEEALNGMSNSELLTAISEALSPWRHDAAEIVKGIEGL